MAWLIGHWSLVASSALGVSEALALLFPSSSGFGGILAGVVKVLKSLGAKSPVA